MDTTFAIRRFFAILLGLLFQWPTLLTLLMFPVLVIMYARLAVTLPVVPRYAR